MIGQTAVLNQIDKLVANNKFPRFSVIVGEAGYGKHELCKYISSKLGIEYLLFDNKIDDLRTFIDVANNQAESYLYVLQDGDSMALEAKNSILKIVEDVPKNAYIVLLIENKNSALETILSRGFTFELNSYTEAELYQYTREKSYETAGGILNVCSCPGDIERSIKVDIKALLEFAEKVLLNVGQVELPNALKIAMNIDTGTGNGYDIKLFFNALVYVLRQQDLTSKPFERNRIVEILSLISNYLYTLRTKAVNKKYLVDNFLINLWMITG